MKDRDREIAVETAFDDFKHRDLSEAEKNLMRAILNTAMEDLKKSGKLQRDAERFFETTQDLYLYSFQSICNHLELCSHTIKEIAGLASGKRVK